MMDKVKFLKDVIVNGDFTVTGTSIAENTEQILTKGALTVINADNNDLNVTLMGTVIRTGKKDANDNYIDYAIIYDPISEAIRLGTGTYDSELNTFAFNQNEGKPVATRDFTEDDDGYLTMWDATNYCLVKSTLKQDKGKNSIATVNNRAISEASIALGKDTMAGSRGFRYLKRDTIDGHHFILKTEETADGTGTTYSYICDCANCQNRQVEGKTFNNKVYYADLATQMSQGRMRVDNDGLVYRHVTTNGKQATTTIIAKDVPAGLALFMKYRLNNGKTPEHSFRVQVSYNNIVMSNDSNGPKPVSELEVYHKGWVIGRINVKGALNTNSIAAGDKVDVQVTIIHTDDLDIAYYCTDPSEDNENVFPQMYKDGDIYYLAQNQFGGHSGTDKWREIEKRVNGDVVTYVAGTADPNNTSANVTDTALGQYKTPYLRDAEVLEPEVPTDEAPPVEGLYIMVPETEDAQTELKAVLDNKPDCTVITNNEYPHINLYEYATTLNDQPIKITVNGTEHTVWRLDFITADFKGTNEINEPGAGWEEDAPYKKTVRINTHPELGDTEIGSYTLTQGINAKALAYASVALGRDTRAEGSYAVAEGRQTRAVFAAHAEGRETEALGDASHAEGFRSKTINTFDHAEGNTTIAMGGGSHAEGSETLAKGEASHAEGSATEALGDASHAEGTYAIASAGSSHAEGYLTRALKDCAHAEGSGTIANGRASHAAGIGTIASADAQTAIGKYNKEDPDALFVVGNGTDFNDNKRSNAFVIKKDGRAYLNGKELIATTIGEPSTGLEYTLNEDKESYAVTGMGEWHGTELVIPAKYKDKLVTKIGKNAFTEGTQIISAFIPSSVRIIDEEAFCCSWDDFPGSLQKVEFESGSQLEAIKASAFRNCDDLTSITIPDSVTSIGDYAFYSCYDLTSITIPDSVTSIGKYAFSDCSSLTNVTIGNGVTSIDNYAFERCSKLKNVTIGNGLESIGDYAFQYCSSLESITLPFVGATKDGTNNTHFSYIFGASSYEDNNSYVPSSLKTVVITGGSSIGDDAFSDCSSLTSVTIPDSVESIGMNAFMGCSSLESIAIPAGITHIALSTFYGCSSLKSVTIGNSVESISAYVFCGCTSLTSINIPDSVKNIGVGAFSDCTSLTSIEIPDSVTSIGYGAFEDCSSLTIYCEAAQKPADWTDDWNGYIPVVWGYIMDFEGVNKARLTATGSASKPIYIDADGKAQEIKNISIGSYEESGEFVAQGEDAKLVLDDGTSAYYPTYLGAKEWHLTGSVDDNDILNFADLGEHGLRFHGNLGTYLGYAQATYGRRGFEFYPAAYSSDNGLWGPTLAYDSATNELKMRSHTDWENNLPAKITLDNGQTKTILSPGSITIGNITLTAEKLEKIIAFIDAVSGQE